MPARRSLALCALTLALLTPASSPARSLLHRTDGPVEVRTNGSDAWHRAGPGTDLSPGDGLRTLAGGRAEVALAGGRLLTLEEKTELTLPRSSYNDAARVCVVDLSAGTLWASIPRLAAGDRFALRTPVALGGVRGTLFRATVDGRGASTFGLVTGRIEVAARTPAATLTTLEAGQELTFSSSGTAAAPRPLDLRAATDAYGSLFPSGPRPSTGAPAPAPAELPQGLAAALADEEKLLAGIRRLTSRLDDVVGDQVELDPTEAAQISALADEILGRSQAKGTEIRRLAAPLPRAAEATALRRWEDLHERITAERHSVAQLVAIPLTDQGREPPPAAAPSASRRDLRFIDTAVRDLGRVASAVASSPPARPVPQRLYRRFEAITERAERQFARLPAPDPETRSRWAGYTRERARTLTSFKTRAVAGTPPPDASPEPAGTQEPDLPSLEDDGSGL